MRHIAVIGSGPAGYYSAEALQKEFGDEVRIDVIDRLPTPFGLVRSGVAPDHQSLKAVSRRYEKVALSDRSEEHTSELQSLMRISYAVFCLKKKKKTPYITNTGSTSYSQLKRQNQSTPQIYQHASNTSVSTSPTLHINIIISTYIVDNFKTAI